MIEQQKVPLSGLDCKKDCWYVGDRDEDEKAAMRIGLHRFGFLSTIFPPAAVRIETQL
jgi:phosphoglycolate phosphatase-like HAD superfamily hydrolase